MAKFNSTLRVLGTIYSEETSWQQPVIARQTDGTTDPGASPSEDDRYLITNASALHANFGTITGVQDNDIVQYDGSDFVVHYDASVVGEGATVYIKADNVKRVFTGSSWDLDGHPDGGDGVTYNAGSDRFDLDLADTAPGLELTASDGSGELRTSTQGNGIAGGAGSLLSVDPATEVAGTRASVYVGADGVGVDLDNSTLDHSTSTLQVKDLGITSGKLASDSVITAKILDANVTAGKLASDSVTTAKIVDANVTAGKLATDSVTTAKIVDANVTSAKLATDSVVTAKILDANVTAGKLASDSVTTAKILDANVTTAKLADDSVDTDKLDYSSTGLRSGAVTDPFTASLTRTFTHSWNNSDVIVEVYDVTTGETCYAEVVRAANTVTITVNQTPTNSLRVMIREVNASETTITVS